MTDSLIASMSFFERASSTRRSQCDGRRVGQELSFLRSNHQVPVVWHQTEREEVDRVLLEALMERSGKCVIVRRLVKDFVSRVASIECTVDAPRFIISANHRLH